MNFLLGSPIFQGSWKFRAVDLIERPPIFFHTADNNIHPWPLARRFLLLSFYAYSFQVTRSCKEIQNQHRPLKDAYQERSLSTTILAGALLVGSVKCPCCTFVAIYLRSYASAPWMMCEANSTSWMTLNFRTSKSSSSSWNWAKKVDFGGTVYLIGRFPWVWPPSTVTVRNEGL